MNDYNFMIESITTLAAMVTDIVGFSLYTSCSMNTNKFLMFLGYLMSNT